LGGGDIPATRGRAAFTITASATCRFRSTGDGAPRASAEISGHQALVGGTVLRALARERLTVSYETATFTVNTSPHEQFGAYEPLNAPENSA